MNENLQDNAVSNSPLNTIQRTKGILLFFFCNTVLLNLITGFLTHEPTVLSYTSAFFQRIAGDDSWIMLRQTFRYLNSEDLQQVFSHQPVYTVLFFQQHIKFIYPPTGLLLFEPFLSPPDAVLPANATLNSVSFIVVLLTAGLMAWLYSVVRKKITDSGTELNGKVSGITIVHTIIPILTVLTFYPLLRSYTLGQIQTWLNCLFAGAVLAWVYDKKMLAGMLCGVMAMIKPQYGLLLLWGVFRKERNFSIGIAITAVLFILVSIDLYGIANNLDYFSLLSYISKHGEAFYPNQSVNGMLNRLFFNGTNLHWEEFSYPPFHPVVFMLTLLSSIALIGSSLFIKGKKSQETTIIDFLIVALSLTMATPIAWEHHYGILLPMFFVVLAIILTIEKVNTSVYVLLGLSYVLCSNVFDFTNMFAGTILNVFQSYLLFGASLLLFLMYTLRKRMQDSGLRL